MIPELKVLVDPAAKVFDGPFLQLLDHYIVLHACVMSQVERRAVLDARVTLSVKPIVETGKKMYMVL